MTLQSATLGLIVLCATSILAEWVEVELADYPITLESTGTAASTNVLRIDPPAGRSWQTQIAQIAREGQYIKANDLLVRFESSYEERHLRQKLTELEVKQSEFEALIELHSQELETEKLNLAEAESNYDKAKRKADQPENLVASVEYEKLIEERELAGLLVTQLKKREEVSKELRQKRRKSLEIAVQRHQVMYDIAKNQYDSFTVRAPHAGLVVIGTDYQGNKLDVNNFVNPGLIVVSLVDDTSLHIEVMAPEHEAALLKLGQKAQLIGDSVGGMELSGEITSLGRTVRRKSRRSLEMIRDFIIELDEQPESLRLGSTLRVIVELGTRRNAIAVPERAISYREGFPGIEVREGWREVELGPSSVDKVIVENGLSQGEEYLL